MSNRSLEHVQPVAIESVKSTLETIKEVEAPKRKRGRPKKSKA